ncbi:MAG TPA: TIGR02147 family protein [Bdellovibrionales bacterium]|nr:TIGR02147 family protein [Bdellovibrionales bacterium]
MIPYACSGYKDVLREALEARKSQMPGRSVSFQAMAEHCGIQKTYLSKVLNREGHLNEDQLFLAFEYLEFDREASDFGLLLLNWEKASTPKRKQRLADEIAKIKRAKLKTEASIAVEKANPGSAELLEYYLDPIYQVIHMCLTVRRLADDPLKIAELLHLRPAALRRYMTGLAGMGIIRFQESRGTYSKVSVVLDNLHLPEDSPLHPAYSARMRMKAVERMETLDKSDAYRFSVVFSTDAKAKEEIHSSFLNWLKGVQKTVQKSSEEEVFQLNFDLFSWTT